MIFLNKIRHKERNRFVIGTTKLLNGYPQANHKTTYIQGTGLDIHGDLCFTCKKGKEGNSFCSNSYHLTWDFRIAGRPTGEYYKLLGNYVQMVLDRHDTTLLSQFNLHGTGSTVNKPQ